MTDLTWQTLVDYVTEIMTREGAKPPRTLYRILGNQALFELSRLSNGVYQRWHNGSGGTLTLSSATCVFPNDLVDVRSVWWDSVTLERKEVSELDEMDPDWRDATGTPIYYTLAGRAPGG